MGANNARMIQLQIFVNDYCATPGVANSTQFHVHCLVHVMHLVIKDGLKILGAAVSQLWDSVPTLQNLQPWGRPSHLKSQVQGY